MRTSRWLVGGLVLSIVVNLLLLGFVAGRLSAFGPPPPFGPDPTAGVFRKLGFLSDERRAALAPEIRKQMGELMPMFRKMRGEQRAVFDALTAEPFDAAALEKALEDLRANLGAAQVASHRSFVEVAKQLTPPEREELANAMRRPHVHAMHGAERGEYDSDRGEHPPFGVGVWSSRGETPQEDR